MINIEEYDPNLTLMAEEILLGPQAEIQQKLIHFNNRHGSSLGVTPTFRWKPGTGNKLKDLYEKHVAAFTMKYSGIYQFFRRIDNRQWSYGNMKRELNNIELLCKSLRLQGLRFQDNSDIIIEAYNDIKTKLIEGMQDVCNTYSDRDIKIDIYAEENEERPTLDNLVFDFTMENSEMSIISHNEEVCRVKLYPTEVTLKVSVFNMINRMTNSSNRGNSMNVSVTAGYLNPGGLQHPYIPYWTQRNSNYHAACLGSHDGNIRNAIVNGDILAAATLLLQWNGSYNIQATHPHNQIYRSFYGLTDDLEALKTMYNPRDMERFCGVRTAISELELDKRGYAIRMDDTCDNIKCTLRDTCNYYNNVKNVSEDRLNNLLAFHYSGMDSDRNVHETAFSWIDTNDQAVREDLDGLLFDNRPTEEQWDPEECMSEEDPEEAAMRWLENNIRERNNR